MRYGPKIIIFVDFMEGGHNAPPPHVKDSKKSPRLVGLICACFPIYHTTTTTVLPYYNITIIPYYNTTILQYYNTTILPYYNTTILQYYNTTILPYYNATSSSGRASSDFSDSLPPLILVHHCSRKIVFL